MEPLSWGTSSAKCSYGARLSDLVEKGQALREETRRQIRWREAQPVTGLGRSPGAWPAFNSTGHETVVGRAAPVPTSHKTTLEAAFQKTHVYPCT